MPIKPACPSSGFSPFKMMFAVAELLLYLLLFLLPIIQAKQPCLISNICGRESIPIRFPFQLHHEEEQKGQNNSCGYPGFNLRCNIQGKTVLRLPNSGDFFVRMIDYEMQMIKLYDPDNCLPRRLLHFNLSGSPFVPAFSCDYTFFSCPSPPTKPGFIAMDCLGNSTTSFFATPSLSGTPANLSSPTCKIITTLQVPVMERVFFYDIGFSANLNEDLQLTWSLPDCGKCEEQGLFCGFKSNMSQETGCLSSAPKSGGSSNSLRVFRIICFSIGLPAMTCIAGVACFACFTDRSRRSTTTHAGRSNSSQGAEAVSAQPAIVVMGLDESTIQSYEKLILGESRRLPGPNDGTCPICLSEYRTKDIVRYIPDCKHCFHADCIDEWLRMNSTCPVCRNSPSPAFDHASNSNNV